MILHAIGRGQGSQPALVMLHGLFGRAANFGTVQARLAAGRRVIALDLRGHGASAHAAPIDYPSMAADVLESLRAQDAWPCDLLGHSMGGKVAMMLALRQPDAVARLIVADIAPVTYPSHFANFVTAMQSLDLSVPTTRAAADAALSPQIPDGDVRGFLLQNFRPGATPGWSCDLAGIARDLRTIEAWPGASGCYAGPSTFLAGSRSSYVRPEGWARAQDWFPQARLVTLEGVGHWLHAEDPDQFVAAVRASLEAGSEQGA